MCPTYLIFNFFQTQTFLLKLLNQNFWILLSAQFMLNQNEPFHLVASFISLLLFSPLEPEEKRGWATSQTISGQRRVQDSSEELGDDLWWNPRAPPELHHWAAQTGSRCRGGQQFWGRRLQLQDGVGWNFQWVQSQVSLVRSASEKCLMNF